MDSPITALVCSFIAMGSVVCSYFVKKKEWFILFQALCITFLIFSYFFSLEFFATVGLSIALVRALVCFAYERKDKLAPMWFSVLICVLTVVAYFVVDWWILGTAKPVDIFCLVASCFYAFIFRVRDMKKVRFLMLIPTCLSILFNTFTHAPLGACLSYVFELTANVIAVFRYYILVHEEDKNPETKENIYEKR